MSRTPQTDPMREIDLLLLEEITMHRQIVTNKTAVLAQTACLSVVGIFFLAAFFYALAHPEQGDPSYTATEPVLAYQGLPQP